MIQLSGDHPLSTTARWHTNNLSITTIIRQHAPKKHVRKKPIFMAFIAKQKYSICCGNAFFFSIGSRGLSQVPFSSIFYHQNVGISIPATTTTNPGATKTKELCQQGHQMPPYSMLNYGSRWLAYAGDDGGEGMIEDMVEVNRFATEHSCLDDNINTNKNQGLFFVDDNDDGLTDCNGVMENNLQCDNINGMIKSLLCHRDDENILRKVVCKKNSPI
jgi:hypothetical protein